MSDSELLQRIVGLLEDSAAERLELKQEIQSLRDDQKTRDERLRGEMKALDGSVTILTGTVDRLNGNTIVLGAVVEELERTDRLILKDVAQLNQGMYGLTHLCKTNFDQNASILEAATGTKGADRPQRTSRPSDPG